MKTVILLESQVKNVIDRIISEQNEVRAEALTVNFDAVWSMGMWKLTSQQSGPIIQKLMGVTDFINKNKGSAVTIQIEAGESQVTNVDNEDSSKPKLQPGVLSQRRGESMVNFLTQYFQGLVTNGAIDKMPEIPAPITKIGTTPYKAGTTDLQTKKDLYQKERIRVIKRLIPLRAKTAELSTKSIFAEMKSAAKSALKKYDDIIKTLQDDSGFEKKKRTERAEEVQNSRFAIISIENELNNTLSKIAIKYGVAKEIDDMLKKSLTSLSSANLSLQEVEKKQSLEAEKTKIEDSESETKEEDPKKSIESYGWKSLKDGEEKQVYYKKEDLDDSKSTDKQKEQIAIGKIVKGSVDDVKKELKIYNEESKKTFTKSISDVIDKAEGDKNAAVKIKEEEKAE
jgi:hypothetical protein